MLARVVEDQRALAHVAQDAGREHEQQPRAGDRRAPEVPHVRVQRLGAGDREHDRGQREERDREVVEEEVQRVGRRQRLEDLGVVGDPAHAARGDGQKPDDHHRAEQPPDGRRADALEQEQHDDDRRGDRDDQVLQRRLGDLEALDRRQHRDRRRDHAVAEEQRRAEDPQRGQRELGPAPARRLLAADQRDQRHDAALAVVVGAHHEQHVGDRDDDRHRPEDHRDDPEDAVGGDRDRVRVVRVEHRLDRVQRARADVAEHHAERTEDHGAPGGARGTVSRRVRGHRGHLRSLCGGPRPARGDSAAASRHLHAGHLDQASPPSNAQPIVTGALRKYTVPPPSMLAPVRHRIAPPASWGWTT